MVEDIVWPYENNNRKLTQAKFGDQYSPLYGNECVYKVTINCQLIILKWMELLAKIPTLEFLQVNTDGVTVRMKRQYKAYYYEQCTKFTKLTNFLLEWVDYSRMAIRDVNNYCCVTTAGKIKTKGEFVYEVKDDYHKRLNFAVSRKAAVDYLLFDKPIEQLTDETDVYRFIGSIRFKKKRKTKANFDDEDEDESGQACRKLEGSQGIYYDTSGNGSELPPNFRFIFSKQGGVIRKVYDDGRNQILFENKLIINANRIEPGNESVLRLAVNHDHYILLARRLVNSVLIGKIKKGKNQLSLW